MPLSFWIPFDLKYSIVKPAGAAAGIESVELPGFSFVDDRKQIAANSIRAWLHDTQGGIGGDGGVDGVASPFEDHRPSLGGQRLAGRHDAELRDDHGARLLLRTLHRRILLRVTRER
jgi:hypothetical protein